MDEFKYSILWKEASVADLNRLHELLQYIHDEYLINTKGYVYHINSAKGISANVINTVARVVTVSRYLAYRMRELHPEGNAYSNTAMVDLYQLRVSGAKTMSLHNILTAEEFRLFCSVTPWKPIKVLQNKNIVKETYEETN